MPTGPGSQSLPRSWTGLQSAGTPPDHSSHLPCPTPTTWASDIGAEALPPPAQRGSTGPAMTNTGQRGKDQKLP